MGRFRGRYSPQMMCPTLLLEIIRRLFPQQERSADAFRRTLGVVAIPAVNTDELLEIRSRISGNKVPGLNGIPNRALKLVVKSKPDMFAELLETCMYERSTIQNTVQHA